MSAEDALAATVLEWVKGHRHGDPAAATAAARVALSRYQQGGTVSEACEEARRLVHALTLAPTPPALSSDVTVGLRIAS